ncbi:flagellar basal-body MS-ring/collar protein FliF [Carboxydothermus hydrogenoformans]|uniref:Flagellar M-ring protein n=1 Tax=Carboxydothermus hydrogenoformans (strain ATCC BAA-161 / DSM 6008 / Z-2901) TaxID=246194 RepID=Q3ADE4_CARHZ|nr:flagellar basal-body MS-ring/collar protein FliF [Carboxydothermus hydrogenoformans]ABB16025.1 flagellar M-ring protein FliF [Carboxydothermus hydrogenoformans Z-2901]
MDFQSLLASIKERFQNLSSFQKRAYGILILTAVLSLLLGYIFLGRPSYTPLATGLDAKEAGAIAEKLKEWKINYKLGDEGTTILVPKSQVYEARIKLASAGVLETNSGIGFELFDQTKLGASDFENQVNYQRALQEELRRTIVQLDAVEDARVHLVLPEKSVFISEEKPATASILLKLKPLKKLTPQEIKGIIYLVANSVEGLKPENVQVVDTYGNVLSDQVDLSSSLSAQSGRQQEMKKQFETELTNRINNLLTTILGPGKAVVSINADLDFNQEETTSQIALPGPLVSEQGSKEVVYGSPGASGTVGTGPNTNQNYPYINGSTNGEVQVKEDFTRNYQVGQTVYKLVKAPGTVKRLSAAIAIDSGVPAADVNKIRDIVAAAMGYDQNRGDQIIINTITFDKTLAKQMEEQQAQAQKEQQARQALYKWLAIGAGALVFLSIIVFFGIRRFRKKPAAVADISPRAPVGVSELEAAAAAERGPGIIVREMTAEPIVIQKVQSDIEKIKSLVDKNPDEVAMVLRAWLTDE